MAFLKIIPRQLDKNEKRCKKCNGISNTVCFRKADKGTKYEGWCKKCRIEDGNDAGIIKLGRPNGSKKVFKIGTYRCMRCHRRFESPIWGNNQHYHLCLHCRRIVEVMDSVGI